MRNIEANNTGDRIIKDTEGARLYGRSRSWFWAKVRAGILPPPIKIDGASGWSYNAIQADIQRRIAEGAGEGEGLVAVAVPPQWPMERQKAEAMRAVRAAGIEGPFKLILMHRPSCEPHGEEVRLMGDWGKAK